MLKLRKITLAISFLFLLGSLSNAQTERSELNEILPKVLVEKNKYSDVFKDLVAEENKTVRVFDKGNLENEKTTRSNLIVYESTQGERSFLGEFRNVLAVDGKAIKNNQKRVEKIFRKANSKKTIEKELDILRKEGLRYDKTLQVDGLTITQAVYLSDDFRPFFEFDLSDEQELNGKIYYVISYQQLKK